MKSFVKWSAAIVGICVGSALAWSAVEAGRRRIRAAIGKAEAVADHTRAALEETEAALHELQTSI